MIGIAHKPFYLLLIIGFICLVLAGCDSDKKAKSDQLVVGLTADSPSIDIVQNDKMIGFEIDLIEKIGTIIKKKFVFKNMLFAELLPALENKRVDAIISTFSVTPEREKIVDFSHTYHIPKICAVFLKTVTEDKKQPFSGARVGVIRGTTLEEWALKLGSVEVVPTDSMMQLFGALRNHTIDMIISEDLIAKGFTQTNRDLDYQNIHDATGGGYAIAVAQNSTLLPKINAALDKLTKDGAVAHLKRKWGLD
ncbi:polar amino acid transport system substrate-binding protein [Alphaproteobacteria bacterium]